jgi:mycofactocin system glycosyltransferase
MLDPSVRTYRDGRVLVGGTPLRVMRLSEAGSAGTRRLTGGQPASEAIRMLGRRLVDSGMAQPVPARTAERGTVTVVVPVRDRPEQLDRCLRALDGAGDRLIVIDDGSTDAAAVAAVCDRYGAERLRHERPAGPAAARNLALSLVSTDYVAFLDSDCVPTPAWISRLAPHLTDPSVAAVAPRIRPILGPRPRSACSRYAAARSPLDMGARGGEVGGAKLVSYVPSAALLVRAGAIAAGFDETLRYGEDVDLVWRIVGTGSRVRYAPVVCVHHQEPGDWRGLLGRRFRYGTSAAPLARRHPGRLAPVVLSPWPALSTILLLARRPLWSAGALSLNGVRLGVRMRRAGAPVALGPVWSLRAAATTLLALGRVSTMLTPLALALALRHRKARIAALILLLAPPCAEWCQRRPALDPLRFTAAAIVDDIAYGAGVWSGCARVGTLAPVMPAIAGTSA